jgi:hypothetical protein
MFDLSECFDFSELEGSPPRRLTVDVDMVQPARTVLHVTPTQPLGYGEIAAEVQSMLHEVGRHMRMQPPLVAEIDWILDRHGVRSDSRGAPASGR